MELILSQINTPGRDRAGSTLRLQDLLGMDGGFQVTPPLPPLRQHGCTVSGPSGVLQLPFACSGLEQCSPLCGASQLLCVPPSLPSAHGAKGP
jgi:hypothetical protein